MGPGKWPLWPNVGGRGFKVQYKNLIAQPGRPIIPTGNPNGASSGSHSGNYMAGYGLTGNP